MVCYSVSWLSVQTTNLPSKLQLINSHAHFLFLIFQPLSFLLCRQLTPPSDLSGITRPDGAASWHNKTSTVKSPTNAHSCFLTVKQGFCYYSQHTPSCFGMKSCLSPKVEVLCWLTFSSKVYYLMRCFTRFRSIGENVVKRRKGKEAWRSKPKGWESRKPPFGIKRWPGISVKCSASVLLVMNRDVWREWLTLQHKGCPVFLQHTLSSSPAHTH